MGLKRLANIVAQLRQQTKLAKAANAQALVEISSPFTLQILSSDELTRLWHEGISDSSTDVEKYQYSDLLNWWLTFYENIYMQNKSGLLEPHVYTAWNSDLKSFIKKRLTPKLWGILKHSYEE